MSFRDAVKLTLEAEGYFTVDTGGPTIMGISKKSWPREYAAIAALPSYDQRAYAEEFFRREFWLKLDLDRLLSMPVAAEIFDTAVNCGINIAVMIAQKAANYLLSATARELLKVDGLLGSKTTAVLNYLSKRYETNLLAALNLFQGMRYFHLVERDPVKYGPSARGWMRRLIIPPEMLKKARS